MKKTIFISAFALILIGIVISSCKKNQLSSQQTGFLVNINNTSFTAIADSAILYKLTDSMYRNNVGYVVGAKILGVIATNASGQQIFLDLADWRDSTIGNSMRLGSYSMDTVQGPWNSSHTICVSATARYYSNNDVYSSGPNSTGAVVINSIDSVNHKISGTFSGVLTDSIGTTVNLTNGSFNNAKYSVYP